MFEEMIESYLARTREIRRYDVKSAILFSSVARGQAKEHSDIDIIVVASGLPKLRNRDVLPPFPKPALIQDCMRPEELEGSFA
ncbi:MAG: nucleotidyltransferase domain-containing protein [Methanothrix sp.]